MDSERKNLRQQSSFTTPRVHPVVGQPLETQHPSNVGPSNAQAPNYLQNILARGEIDNSYPPTGIVVTQPAPVVTQPTQRAQDYLTLSLISIFFFFPVGACAIIYSCQSRVSAASGDYSRSLSEGRTARNLSIVAIVLAILITIAIVVPIVVTIENSRRHYYYHY